MKAKNLSNKRITQSDILCTDFDILEKVQENTSFQPQKNGSMMLPFLCFYVSGQRAIVGSNYSSSGKMLRLRFRMPFTWAMSVP